MEQGLEHKCPFCREPIPETLEEADQNEMKRIKANDPVALRGMGVKCREEGNYERAFEYFTKAAVLGNIESHYEISLLYGDGKGVEKDKKKEIHYLEEAAIGGHPDARHNLGCVELGNRSVDRAVKHYTIAAKLGHDGALEALKKGFEFGLAKKEDYEAALRGHQAAVDATKSQQRDAAAEWFKKHYVHEEDYENKRE